VKKRITFILILALIVGGAISIYAYKEIKAAQAKELDLTPVVVASAQIEAYSNLSPDNIKIEYVSSKFVDEFTAKNVEEITDKITMVPLYPGRPIDIRLVADKPEEIGEGQVVGVNIDSVRFAGVTEGDTVDVYRLDIENLAAPAQKIASNAKVLKVTDEKNISINEANNIARSAAASAGLTQVATPRIVYLLVKPEEVPYVIQGSLPGSTVISLSKKPAKDSYDKEVIAGELNTANTAVEQQPKQQTGASSGTNTQRVQP